MTPEASTIDDTTIYIVGGIMLAAVVLVMVSTALSAGSRAKKKGHSGIRYGLNALFCPIAGDLHARMLPDKRKKNRSKALRNKQHS